MSGIVRLLASISVALMFWANNSVVLATSVVPGVVVLDHYTCNTSDHIVIETALGYTIAEVYSGYSATYESKTIQGEFHSYGFTDIYDRDGDEVGRVYVEYYMVDESRAKEWCSE